MPTETRGAGAHDGPGGSLPSERPVCLEGVSSLQLATNGGPHLALVAVPVLLVLITYLFWRQTWFGTRLADAEMGHYLTDTSVPHKTQHALSQLAGEMAREDPQARRWYPQLIKLAQSSEPQFRVMTAWVMGQDNKTPELHAELLKLVQDPDDIVRWNASLALVRFGDPSGEPQLHLMLRPYHLLAPEPGTVNFSLKEGESTRAGSVIARVRMHDGRPLEVRSPLAGELERQVAGNGTEVKAGDLIATLAPGEEQVWEALRALYLVGRQDDLEDVDRFARGVCSMPERVRQQALLTARMIRKRKATSDR